MNIKKINLWLSEQITCEQAAYLVAKKKTSNLTLVESFDLRIHLFACEVCKKYSEDLSSLDKYIKRDFTNDAEKRYHLSIEQRSRLMENLEKIIEK